MGFVGDDGDPEDGNTGVPGHNHFRNGGHAHSIAAYDAEVLVFGRGLIRGAGSAHIHALVQGNTIFGSYLQS